MVTSLYSSNNPALCICHAIGPVLPYCHIFEIKYLNGLISYRLGDRHTSCSLCGIH